MSGLRVPNLRGRRLTLEPLSAQHTAGMFELWSEPKVCQYSGECVDADGKAIRLPASSSSESDRLLRFWVSRAEEGTGFRWAVLSRERSEFLGAVGFNSLGARAEYAYHFIPRNWGAGLASEAAGLAFSWAQSTGARSIEAFILPENVRSVLHAERMGFERRGPGQDRTTQYVLTLDAPAL